MNLSQIKWCTEQVEMQHDSPFEVLNMCWALETAIQFVAIAEQEREPIRSVVHVDFIFHIAKILKGEKGDYYRSIPVTFANGTTGLDAGLIHRAMTHLFSAIEEGTISPLEAYVEFEKIHPFEDGNGRIGAILYNILNNTIHSPVHVPFQFDNEVGE